MTDPSAYAAAPDLYDEQQELARSMRTLPVRERLLRLAAVYDRGTLHAADDPKAGQPARSSALKLADHDRKHGTAAGPLGPDEITTDTADALLRAYIRQEYAAWSARTTTSTTDQENV
jgi:hypothetical protein